MHNKPSTGIIRICFIVYTVECYKQKSSKYLQRRKRLIRFLDDILMENSLLSWNKKMQKLTIIIIMSCSVNT